MNGKEILLVMMMFAKFNYFAIYFVIAIPCFVGLVVATPVLNSENGLVQSKATDVTFTLFATDMTGCDDASACDLYVKIFCTSTNTEWQQCGQTSKRQDDYNPVWPEVFTFPHNAGTSQRWRFDLIDVDVAFDDLIASVEVSMDEYVNAPGNLYQIPVPGNTGIFWIQRQR